MIDEKTRDRWNALATVDEDIRAMLAEIDRLTEALASRPMATDIDPTGGLDPKFSWGGDP